MYRAESREGGLDCTIVAAPPTMEHCHVSTTSLVSALGDDIIVPAPLGLTLHPIEHRSNCHRFLASQLVHIEWIGRTNYTKCSNAD